MKQVPRRPWSQRDELEGSFKTVEEGGRRQVGGRYKKVTLPTRTAAEGMKGGRSGGTGLTGYLMRTDLRHS